MGQSTFAITLKAYTKSQTDSDADLVASFQQGDQDAYRRLYELHKDRVYSIATSFLHADTASAEDVVQDVFVRLHAALPGFRSDSDFTTWLYRVVSNSCIDELRKRKRIVQLEAIETSAFTHPPYDAYAQSDLRSTVQGALNSLTDDARLAVLMKYYAELSYNEIAVVMDCKKGTVASRLNRALKALAEKLSCLRDGDEDMS